MSDFAHFMERSAKAEKSLEAIAELVAKIEPEVVEAVPAIKDLVALVMPAAPNPASQAAE